MLKCLLVRRLLGLEVCYLSQNDFYLIVLFYLNGVGYTDDFFPCVHMRVCALLRPPQAIFLENGRQ